MPLQVAFTLSDKDLRHFRRHMKAAQSMASEMGEPAIVRAAEGLLGEIHQVKLPDFISERLERLQVLIEILRDKRWDLPQADRGRILAGLAYFTDPDDMIPDEVPVVGYLDDAIMIELIVRELRHDIEGYQDFCAAEGSLKQAKKGTAEDQRQLQVRRERLQRRIRRRTRASRDRSQQRGARISLW
ncbi:MAG: DUF1232 domain-containing protein [Myxococcota bacterium]|nr:DUF1232 domain-containing protein [Myxococcota bacterium]